MLCLRGHGIGLHLPVAVGYPLFGTGEDLDREAALGPQPIDLFLLLL